MDVTRLRAQGVAARRVQLPDGQDPNSFFVEGGDARQFQHLLEGCPPMTFQVVAPNRHPKAAQSPLPHRANASGCEVGLGQSFSRPGMYSVLGGDNPPQHAHDLPALPPAGGSVSIKTDTVTEKALTESTLLEYDPFPSRPNRPGRAAATINRR